MLRYCQYYSIVFGGYVALALWMVQYYVGEYGLDIRVAALLAACFSLPGGVLRAFGGWLSDKYGAHTRHLVGDVGQLDLPVPAVAIRRPTSRSSRSTARRPSTSASNVYAFTALMFILGIAWAFGKASVFKYISDDYPHNIGTISGIVGLAGGLGGFVLPIMFGALMDLTGVRSSAFMLMYGVVWVSLIWMYFTEVRRTEVMGDAAPAGRRPARTSAASPGDACQGAAHEQPRMTPTATARSPRPRPDDLDAGGQGLLGAAGRSHRQAQPVDQRARRCSSRSRSGRSGAWSPSACPRSASSTRPTSCSGWRRAPALSGATLRIFYSFMVPIVGGRRWTAISTAIAADPGDRHRLRGAGQHHDAIRRC